MKNLLLLLLLTNTLFGALSDTIHSSASTYIETKSFSSSLQKNDSKVYGVGADIHHNHSAYKITYEYTITDTKQPPLTKDLKVDKLFAKYAYEFSDSFEANLNYLSVLNDNIAITDGGDIYGLGLTYNLNKFLTTNFTQFYSDYDDFNVYQSDLRIDYKTKLNEIKVKLSSITKYITIDEENINSFTKNTDDEYLTSGFKLHAHYKSYHFGAGAYFGKRVFAIMNDGFKVQHHAMEIKETYAIGFGKIIPPFVLRAQYIYQLADELGSKKGINKDVRVDAYRLMVNYKF